MIRRAALLLLLVLAGCGLTPRNPDAPPRPAYEAAEVVGFPAVRAFGDSVPEGIGGVITAFLAERRAARQDERHFDVLALSGGGSDGAFGAGLLKGWSEHGDRPEFDMVTGISTGALIAPFAFLGPDEDLTLENFYTRVTTPEILTLTLFDALTGGPALADSAPLRRILERQVTPELVARIGAEHRRGRRLYIGTTNLDAQRPVIWDIGAIATSGNPEAPGLIRNVMLASASIPGAFPPVLFGVEAGAERYQEVHVDGGVTKGIFAWPPAFRMGELMEQLGTPRDGRRLWLVRNAKLAPEYTPPGLGVVPISSRSISTLIKSQTIGNLVEIEQVAARDGFTVHLAFVEDGFDQPSTDIFDPVYMSALYALGNERGRAGYPWVASVYDVAGRR